MVICEHLGLPRTVWSEGQQLLQQALIRMQNCRPRPRVLSQNQHFHMRPGHVAAVKSGKHWSEDCLGSASPSRGVSIPLSTAHGFLAGGNAPGSRTPALLAAQEL